MNVSGLYITLMDGQQLTCLHQNLYKVSACFQQIGVSDVLLLYVLLYLASTFNSLH